MFETVILNGAALGYYVMVAAEVALAAYAGYKIVQKAGRVVGNMKLQQQIKQGKLDVKQLDERGRTHLMNAKTAVQVETLIKQGIDVNAVDVDGKTALMYAAERGDKKSVQILLNAGAKIDDTDKCNNSALHYAARWGNCKTLKTLIEAGADVNVQNNAGRTALMCIADRNYIMLTSQEEAMSALLCAGADNSIKDKNGKTAADYYTSQDGVSGNENYHRCFKMLTETAEDKNRENTKKTMLLQGKKGQQRIQNANQPQEQAIVEPKQTMKKKKQLSANNEGR